MGSKESGLTVLMFPWLAHGHISPFLELAKKLTKRNFFIYFCSTPINLISINKRLGDNYSSSIKLVELHLPSLPELPPHYHTTNGLPPHLMPTLKKACKLAKPNLSNIFNTLKPDFLIFDILFTWIPPLASSHNIPDIQFLTTGAAVGSFFTHLFSNPGVEYPIPSVYLRDYEMANIRRHLQLISKDAEEDREPERPQIRSSENKIMLIKSFKEVEGKYIDYFSTVSKRKIVPVGPLVEEPIDDADDHMEFIHEWLNNKDESSTVFVSFGSEYFLSREEIEDIGYGLELSDVNFIWVIRFPVGEKNRVLEEVLPQGFLERVRERGMVVEGWAPQARILGHSSIGGFVSHCGWGSMMETMKFGVPIIALPMHLDQPLNARVVVEVGVGVEVMRENDGRFQREGVAKVIREVVVEKTGEDVRRKAREFSETIRLKGEKEIDGAVEELVQLSEKNKGQ